MEEQRKEQWSRQQLKLEQNVGMLARSRANEMRKGADEEEKMCVLTQGFL